MTSTAIRTDTGGSNTPVGSPWLTCRGVSKSYGGVVALSGIDLDLVAGEVHGLIGPNGAGKSTLVKILGGAVKRDSGSVSIDGEEVDFADPAVAQSNRLILMPQEIAIVPNSTVVDNVTLGSEATRGGFRSPRACRAEAEQALDAVGLDVNPYAYAASLAPAHQRMLMMARAIHRHARLLIFDEPTAGLAEHEAELVTQAVRRLLDEQLTVIYVSHHLSEVASLSDRVTCVRESRIAATLTGDEVTKDSLVKLLLDVPDVETSQRVRIASAVADTERAGSTVVLENVSGLRLKDASLRAVPGEVTGLTGLLGSGAAEMVGFLVGVSTPESGTFTVDDVPARFATPAAALERGIGYLPGDRGRSGFMNLPIRENVSLSALRNWFGRLGLISRRRERTKVDDVLQQLSVKGSPARPLSALSGGNQQRALVSRLIAADVKVLVLDEPTVGVDIRARQELWDALRALSDEHTVIVASSDPEELVALADRVICIRHGRVATVLEGRDVTEHAITAAIA